MKIGYVRVSTEEQNEALQMDALKEAGCEKFFADKGTGAKFERKGLEEMLSFVRPGDVVQVWKLDRLGRSLKDLIETLNTLNKREVNFVSLTEKIDTTTPGGKLIFHLMGDDNCCPKMYGNVLIFLLSLPYCRGFSLKMSLVHID